MKNIIPENVLKWFGIPIDVEEAIRNLTYL